MVPHIRNRWTRQIHSDTNQIRRHQGLEGEWSGREWETIT